MINRKIATIGEALVDWVCLDKTLDLYEAKQFIKVPGGAPTNVAIGLAKLNYPVQLIGGFSKDVFGKWLKEFISSFDIDISLSIDIQDSNTRHAYILTDKSGGRVLKGFTMQQCADSMIDFDKIDLDTISESPLVYFGSLLQVDEKSRFTLSNIINTINTNNIIFYDPNLRLCMWPDKDEAIKIISDTFKMVDIVKLSEDEISLITGTDNIETAARKIFYAYNLKLLVVTLGSKGSFYINKQGFGNVRPFKVETIEETGAGDGFVAGVLGSMFDLIAENYSPDIDLNIFVENLTGKDMENILLRANAIGALTTTKPGATAALPTREELDIFLESRA